MKRFVCFLLALIMILGMIPNTVITANAYSKRDTSAKAIDILRGSETFYAKSNGTKVGYNTPVSYDPAKQYLNSITKEDAVDLMRDYIEDVVDEAINTFAKNYNIDLNQNEHDALAVHYYRNGNAVNLFNAVRTIKTVNSAADRADIVKTFTTVHTHDATSAEALLPTLNVSMAEAAMYLYGDYGYNGGSKLAYTLLDTDGDLKSDDFAAFVKNDGYTLNPEGANFLGWFLYDAEKKTITGAPLSKLTKDHNGAMVVAKQATGGNDAAEYKINTNTLSDLNVYTYGSAPVQTGEKLKNHTEFKVSYEFLQDTVDENGNPIQVKWVCGTGTNTDGKEVKGWVKVGKLEAVAPGTDKPIASATVTSATLSVYPGATADGAAPIATLSKNDVVDVYEIKIEKTETGNRKWGKVSFEYAGVKYIGWINLANTEVNETAGDSGAAEGQTGKIANAETVNVRSSAGIVASPSNWIASLSKGTKVTVLEMNSDKTWAKIKWSTPSYGYTEGWVYMHYVQLDSAPEGSDAVTPDTVKYTGVVNTNNLNVRKRADIYSTKVDTLNYGTKVNVYETKTSRNMKWGRIGDSRWVCLTYLNLTEVKQPAAGSTTTTNSLQGTVTAVSLDILKNYNSNAEKVGTLKKNDVVTILEKNTEQTETGSRIWGRISKDGVEGWINLAYVELKNVTSVNGTTGSTGTGVTNSNGASAVVSNCISVNVREGAGVSNAQITKLNNGTAVKVYEQVTKDNAPWAKITWDNGAKSGWVCMNYVTMTTGSVGTTTEGGLVNGTNSNTISATGIVNSNIDLNVRSIAGLNGIKLGALKKGAKVTVYEQVSADGMIWGRIPYGNGSGWICMSYITIESASSTGKGVMGTVARCFAAVNVRSAPGTNNALINKINVGTRVEVFETRQQGNTLWGRVAQGWVSMDYILLDSELPPGTVLDATEPTTEATNPGDETVNRDGEVAFKVEGVTLKKLDVYNDADDKSDRVGSVNSGIVVDIRAVMNNGAELWGRIDQYATAGWINMDKANVNYMFKDMYVNTDDQPIYTDANMNSTVKGALTINTNLDITKITTDGTNVYGWVEEGIFGWIPMSKLSTAPVDVIPTYKSGDSVGDSVSAKFTGKTFAAMDAHDSIGGTKVLFKVTSGVNVAIEMVKLENGKVWGCVVGSYGEYAHAWIDMSKVNYSLTATLLGSYVNVRSSMDADSETNIIAECTDATIQVCQLAFDGYGNLWARVNYNADASLNGAFVMVKAAAQDVDGMPENYVSVPNIF